MPVNNFTNVCAIFQCLMKLRTSLCVAVALLFTGCGPKSDSPQKALVGAVIIDGTGAPAVSGGVVLLDQGIIKAIGSGVAIPDGFDKVNVGGKFIIPGLIDARVTPNADLRAFVLAGITSVGQDTPLQTTGSRVFSSLGKQAGFADQVVASNEATPSATLAKIDRMAKAEIPPLQIIQSATLNGALWLQQPKLGAIKPGYQADLVILDADPLLDIKNLRRVSRVMVGGRWVAPAPGK